jgi:hypothetical protein
MTGEPKVGGTYYFVRLSPEGRTAARWALYPSAGVLLFGECPDDPVTHRVHDWRDVLHWLQGRGYVEAGEAIRAGKIGKDEADALASRVAGLSPLEAE